MHRPIALAAFPLTTAAALAGTTTVFDADFEAFTLGSPPPLAAAADRPESIEPAAITTVENNATIAGPALSSGNFLRVVEDTAPEAPNLRFDRGLGFNAGVVNIAFDLLIEVEENYSFNFRPTGNSAGQLLNMGTDGNTLNFTAGGSTQSADITSGAALRIGIEIDLDARLINATVNGVDVVTDLATDDNEFGSINFGFAFSNDDPTRANGAFQLDNLLVTQIPAPGTAGLLAAAGLAAVRRRR